MDNVHYSPSMEHELELQFFKDDKQKKKVCIFNFGSYLDICHLFCSDDEFSKE